MIRLATPADAAQIAAIYRPFCEDLAVSFETVAPPAAEIAHRIERTTATFPWLVDVTGDTVNGYAYATSHRGRPAYRWAVETSIYLAEPSRKQGRARSLYAELFNRLREQGLYKAYAGITVPNPDSQGFHEALGFKLVGIYRKIGFKLGAWRDVGWWELDLQSAFTTPAEPKPPLHRRPP
jgi:phosphinothricin acetyltransferase